MNAVDFSSVRYPTYSRSACSPAIAEDLEGLVLAAPGEVDLSARAYVPICGAYRLRHSVLKTIDGSPIEQIVLNFVEQGGDRLFSFNLKPDKDQVQRPKEPGRSPDPAAAAPGPAVADDYFVKGYFNIDALTFYTQFPRDAGHWVVYAVLKSYKSNSVEIKVQP